MRLFSKFRVLQFLVLLSFIQAGRIRMKRNSKWFVSVHTALYICGAAALVNNLYEQIKLTGAPMPPPETITPQNAGNTTTGQPLEADMDPLFTPPWENITESEDEVVRLSMTTNGILSTATCLVLRLFGFLLYPRILKTFQALVAREFAPSSHKWSRDELLFILVILCAVGLQAYDTIARAHFRFRSTIHSIQEILRTLSFILLAQCYPLDCTAFVLLVFTKVVAENLKELSSYMGHGSVRSGGDNPEDEKESERVGVGDETMEKRLESLLDFELKVKLNSLKESGSKAGKASTKSNQTLFILQHQHPSLEIRGSKDLAYLTQRYLRWHEVWEGAALVTGFSTLFLFLNYTVNLCIYAFTGLSDLGKDGIANAATLQNGALAILTILRLLCLGNVAQQLLDVGEDLEEKLILEAWEEENSHYFLSLDMDKEKQISYLLHHMAHHPIRLSALGFFTASRSTLTSISGVIVTYLVVLIQFGSSS